MTSYLLYILLHFIVCVLFFVLLQRPAFIMVNKATSDEKITGSETVKITKAGLASDLAAAAYLTAPSLLVLWAHAHAPFFALNPVLLVCEGIVALIMSLITIADTVLYGPWRFRIDATVFAYLQSLKGAFASVSVAYIIIGVLGVLLLADAIFGCFWALAALTGVFVTVADVASFGTHALTFGCFVLSAAVVFAFIRGLRHRPNSPYQSYYSSNMFCNHATVNPVFNMIYSFSLKNNTTEQYHYYPDDECRSTIEGMIPTEGTPQIELLNNKRPKTILFVIWESLSAYFVEQLGGKANVNPNFDRLCNEGVLFTRVDAGSYRTDPALVCILSGYPGQPTTRIMRSTQKLHTLPGIPRVLSQHGYSTTAVHGGNLSIMHIIDYFLAIGNQRIVSVKDMPAEAPRNAWGVHDNFMFQWLYDDLVKHSSDPEKRFVSFLTLSSHQPFDVPYSRLEDKIENAYAFTDEYFGQFVDRLKQHPMWDDTLIVVLGDHGTHVGLLPMKRDVQPHIPILLLGGAVKEPRRIDTIMSQTDLAATLLGQLGIDHKEFTFSRDVLADTYTQPFAMHSYNNGFVYRDPTGYTDYDNVSQKAVDGADDERERRGRMFLQYMMADLAKR